MKRNLARSDHYYNFVMNAYIRAGKFAGAVQTFDLMKKNYVPRTQHSLSTLIRALGYMNETAAAVEVFRDIEEPNVHCYAELMVAHFRSGEEEEGLRLFEALKTSKEPMNAVIFSIVMKQFAKQG